MKRSVIEQKLNDAMQRQASAQSNEWSLDREIRYHDQLASETRKDRNKVRAKRWRAEETIKKLNALLAGAQQ